MARNRPFDTYPNEVYWALVQRVLETGEPFTVPCSRTQAASMRGELYAWRRACETDIGLATQYGVNVDKLRTVTWRIVEGGLQCCLTSSLPGPSLIAQALGAAAPTDTRTPAQRALDALRAGLGKEEA